ncbi:MAG TPA: hypothetical protein VL049_04045, partial [Candidatus Dormibacteraeota bacterium]|nr:hypothetical protein [Candidatus Dormibacteraeota bacterium]
MGLFSRVRRQSAAPSAAAATRYAEELAQLQEQLAAQHEDRERLSQQLAEQAELLQSAEQNLGVLEMPASEEIDGDDDVLEIDREAPEPSEAAAEASIAADDGEADSGELFLLDGDDSATAAALKLAEFGHRVSALAPSISAADSMKGRRVAGAAVNLAAADAVPDRQRQRYARQPRRPGARRHRRNAGLGLRHLRAVAAALVAARRLRSTARWGGWASHCHSPPGDA